MMRLVDFYMAIDDMRLRSWLRTPGIQRSPNMAGRKMRLLSLTSWENSQSHTPSGGGSSRLDAVMSGVSRSIEWCWGASEVDSMRARLVAELHWKKSVNDQFVLLVINIRYLRPLVHHSKQSHLERHTYTFI